MKSASLILPALAATGTASPLATTRNRYSAPHPVSVPIERRPNTAAPGVKAKANLHVSRARFSPKSKGVAKRGSLLLTDVGDQFYYTTVTIGSGQSFKVDLDTGSSDLWVPGPQCSSSDGSCTAGGGHINLSDRSVHDAGVSFSDSYGSESASGEKGYFGVSTSESGFSFQAQGLLVLSFSFGADGGVKSSVGEVPIAALGLKSFG
ncbi:aspartic peptidase domain-containing protein, partial [Blyttiomyces helicus]